LSQSIGNLDSHVEKLLKTLETLKKGVPAYRKRGPRGTVPVLDDPAFISRVRKFAQASFNRVDLDVKRQHTGKRHRYRFTGGRIELTHMRTLHSRVANTILLDAPRGLEALKLSMSSND